MLINHNNITPTIDPTATISPGAIISGDVHIGAHTIILPGAVITSQGAPVRIQSYCIIMENAVIRGAGKHPTNIEDHVLVGPHAHITGATIKNSSFIATGASVFNGAILESESTVAINGIVHINAHCAESSYIPMGFIAIGSPAKIYSPHEAPAVHQQLRQIGFTKTVFGFDSKKDKSRSDTMVKLCERYIKKLKNHKNDRIVE